MKLFSTLTLFAVVASLNLSAQSSEKPAFKFSKRAAVSTPKERTFSGITLAKTTAAASRLVAVTQLQYTADSLNFIVMDTAHVSYSGTRGGDLNSDIIKFDQGTSWTNNGAGLENSEHFTQAFDNNDNILNGLSQEWNGSTWVNSYGTAYTYDLNNNMTSETELEWNTGTSVWDSSYRYDYTYDVNNKLTSEMGMSFNGTTWVNDYFNNNTLDNNGNTLVSTYASWNTGTNAWDSLGKTVFTYNTNNLVTAQLDQNWDGMSMTWENNSQVLTTYDLNSNVLTVTQQSWDGTQWSNSFMTTNTTLNSDIVNTFYQNWDGTAWVNVFNETNTFDGNHNNISTVSQMWNTTAYEPVGKVDRMYNSYSQLTSEKDATWNGTSWVEDDGNSWGRYYYENYNTTGVKNIAENNTSFTVYPVPARSSITVAKTWEEPQSFSVSILDMQGRMVRTYSEKATASYSRNIDVNQLPAGNYVIKMIGTKGKAAYQQFTIAH